MAQEIDENKEQRPARSPLFPPSPRKCSGSLYRFLKEHDEILGLFFFLVRMATHFDKASMNAKRVLDKVEGKTLPEIEYRKQPLFRQIRLFSREIARNWPAPGSVDTRLS